MVPMMDHHRVPCTGTTHGAFLRPTQIWLLRRYSLHTLAMEEDVLRTRGAAEKVAAGPTLSVVRRDYQEKSVSFVHSEDPTVAMGLHEFCRGGGGKLQREASPLSSGPLRRWR